MQATVIKLFLSFKLFIMKSIKRRTFLAAAATLTAGTAAMALPSIPYDDKKILVHHVFFWLKNPDSAADRDELISGLKNLGKIESIRKIHIGIPAATEKRPVVDTSWHVSELMFFDDLAGQKAYQEHPMHVAFAKDYSHLWEKVLVYDVEQV